MSQNSQGHFRNPPRTIASELKHKQETNVVIERLNAQLKHLSEHLLNRQPYLLSVPSDVPYRHSSRFVNNWHLGTPFTRDEEPLQYVSFLPHQDEGEDLLRVVGGWSDDKGNMLEEDEESPGPVRNSGHNTPSDSQRKKITLNDYKTKAKSSTEPSAKSKQPEDPMDLPSKGKGKEDKPTEEKPSAEKTENNLDSTSTSRGVKWTRDGSRPMISNLDGAGSQESKAKPQQEPPRPEERQRTASPDTHIKPEVTLPPVDTEYKKSNKLPGLLSPTLPSPEKRPNLPQPLSPTLPPSIAKYLTKNPNGSVQDSQSDHNRTDSVRSILAAAGLNGEGHKRSDSQHSVRSTLSAASDILRIPSPALKHGVKTPLKPGTPLHNGVRASPGPRQRHIIVLKYGKKNRKRVEGLLKFAHRSKKPDPRNVVGVGVKADTPEPSGGIGKPLDSVSRPKKRLLEESPEVPSKKHKPLPSALSAKERPSTPIPTSFQSPKVYSSTTVTKSNLTTPKMEFKSSAMARVASNDSVEARTPTGSGARLSTPLSTDRATAISKTSPQPTSAPANRDQERAAWKELNEKYFALGRIIKREATALVQDGEPNTKESALSVVLLIEALVCFMINLSAEGNNRSGQDPGWNTIIAYHIFVFRASRKFPHLHGIVTQLGAVCRQYIHKFDMDRLARDPLPDDQVGSAPTPGSDGNTKTTEDGEKYKKKYLEFRDLLVRNFEELNRAWMSGSRELPLDAVEREYPRTWAKRARDSSLRGVGKPNPSKISADFFLPLDANTTAFEAGRFALAFLEEWADKEGVAWKTRIEL